MRKYKEVKGDLIEMAKQGKFHVIAHGCNCFCTMGAGIAPQMAKAFGCDMYPKENRKHKGDINKLGTIEGFPHQENTKDFVGMFAVVNAYTQFGFGRNHAGGVDTPLDYEALTLCLRKINYNFEGLDVGLPKIGCGLAGGDWKKVKKIIKEELKDCNVTIVIYENNTSTT